MVEVSNQNIFQFKQFLISQDNCAMKVNTDGCLLGAWCNPLGTHLLDVGTGSGVIALMLAQRNSHANIGAIDIDAFSCLDAKYNFSVSPWQNRLQLYHTDFLQFDSSNKFDLIVSNPPFFKNGMKSIHHSRNISRHNDKLSPIDFLRHASQLMKIDGRMALIIPYSEFASWQKHAFDFDLNIGRICYLRPSPNKPIHRVMVEFGKQIEFQEQQMCIRNEQETYTQEFTQLLSAFYLKL